MKFIPPKEWITPEENMSGIGDVSPLFAHIGTALQFVSYPVVAAVTGVGAIVTRARK
jgi:hypothetical protein